MIPFAALNWTYLSKPIFWMRNREFVVYFLFGSYFLIKTKSYIDRRRNYNFVEARKYNHDESNINFRDRRNMTDGAVSRMKILKFRENVFKERAVREREAMIDGYDYLNGTNLKEAKSTV